MNGLEGHVFCFSQKGGTIWQHGDIDPVFNVGLDVIAAELGHQVTVKCVFTNLLRDIL